MQDGADTPWERFEEARKAARSDPAYSSIGSNRVPEDTSDYKESSSATGARIAHIVAHSLM